MEPSDIPLPGSQLGLTGKKREKAKEVRKHIEAQGYDFSAEREYVATHFADQIITHYQSAMDNVLDSAWPENRDTLMQSARIERTKRHRIRKGQPLQMDDAYLMWAAADIDLGTGFPRGREISILASCSTINVIGTRYRLCQAEAPLTRAELIYLHICGVTEVWDTIASGVKPAISRWGLEMINEFVLDCGEPVSITRFSDLQRLNANWKQSWVLFHSAQPYLWEYYHDDPE